MVKVILSNNVERNVEYIFEETASIQQVIDETGFNCEGAALSVGGVRVTPSQYGNPLVNFLEDGATQIRITAVAKRDNA